MDVNAKPGGMISSFELGNRLRVKKTWSKRNERSGRVESKQEGT